jgi:hypothetical protein
VTKPAPGRADPSAWIIPGDGAHVFRTAEHKRAAMLMPLHRLIDRRQSVYWRVTWLE